MGEGRSRLSYGDMIWGLQVNIMMIVRVQGLTGAKGSGGENIVMIRRVKGFGLSWWGNDYTYYYWDILQGSTPRLTLKHQ